MSKRRTASFCSALFALLALSCSPDSSASEAPAEAPASTTTVVVETTEPSAANTSNDIVIVGADDSAAYGRVLLRLEDAGFVWPATQSVAFETAVGICTNIAESTSVEQLTGVALGEWADDVNSTPQSWENLKRLYATLPTEYCPAWWLPASALDQTPAESEAFVQANVSSSNEEAFLDLLAGQDPRSAALYLNHLPDSEFVDAQIALLVAERPETALAISEVSLPN